MKRPLNDREKHFLNDVFQNMADQIQPVLAEDQQPVSEKAYPSQTKIRLKISRRRRVVYILIALTLILILAACTIRPMREFILEQFEKFTSINVTTGYADTKEIDIGYMPERYQVVDEIINDNLHLLVYGTDSGEICSISFEQGASILSKNADTEDGEEITIKGWSGILIRRAGRADLIALQPFSDGCLELIGPVTEAEAVKILESVNERKDDMKNRIGSLLLVMVLCFSLMGINAEAAIGPQWDATSSITNNFTISKKTASIYVYVRCDSSITSIGVTSEVQKKSGSTWSTVKTYTKTFNTFYGSFTESYGVSAGEYRLKTTVRPYRNGVMQEPDPIILYTYATA